jgi:hypothetical protein
MVNFSFKGDESYGLVAHSQCLIFSSVLFSEAIIKAQNMSMAPRWKHTDWRKPKH